MVGPHLGPCERCKRLTMLESFGGGLLHVCTACRPSPGACPAQAHMWRGTETPGVWVCHQCAERKHSEAIDVNRMVYAERN